LASLQGRRGKTVDTQVKEEFRVNVLGTFAGDRKPYSKE